MKTIFKETYSTYLNRKGFQKSEMKRLYLSGSKRVYLVYLFGVLRGNQCIQFVRVLYCKLSTNGKQLPAFPHEAVPGIPASEVGGESVTTLPPWPQSII